jgi:predicted nucleic acid-binding protein
MLKTQNLFLDTNIIVDYIIPHRRTEYACSYELVERIKKGKFKGWSTDYALAETLGNLKKEREISLQKAYVLKEVVTPYEVAGMVKIIQNLTQASNFNVFAPTPIPQVAIFNEVKDVCVQATDAFVLLSVIELRKKLPDVVLVTRDERLLVRGSKEIPTSHPIGFMTSCPSNCKSKLTCKHQKP